MKQLKLKGLPFIALSNNKNDSDRISKLGAEQVVIVDSGGHETWIIPDLPIGNVYLFENSFNLCCRYIQMCRGWTSKPIYVITHSFNPRLVYRGLGAEYVIYTHNDDVSFLIQDDRGRESK